MDIVKTYANDKIAEKYRIAVTATKIVLSLASNACICSMRLDFRVNKYRERTIDQVFTRVGGYNNRSFSYLYDK